MDSELAVDGGCKNWGPKIRFLGGTSVTVSPGESFATRGLGKYFVSELFVDLTRLPSCVEHESVVGSSGSDPGST